MPSSGTIPATQRAIRLIGPDRLILDPRKPVLRPGPTQFLCRVEVVGLCFSDIKLLKQFSRHVRKGPVLAGLDPETLAEIPGYVPGEAPTVPGHEPVVEVIETGSAVMRFQPGERYFLQADWRWLKTESSNGAFGYNFEGALQEYVLLDERILLSPEGESMLLPAPAGDRSAAAFGLVEPWACVEQSYRFRERRAPVPEGRLLMVCENGADPASLQRFLAGRRAEAPIHQAGEPILPLPGAVSWNRLEEAPLDFFDDILYFGARPETAARLFAHAARNGLILFCSRGKTFGRPVSVGLGAVHYRGIRMAGTPGSDPARALERIPESGEIRPNDRILIVGAGGPMGVMHIMRNLSEGAPGISVVAGDISDERLDALTRIAQPVARTWNSGFSTVNLQRDSIRDPMDYQVIMAPVPRLVAEAVSRAAPGGRINIFAGIPADQCGEVDLDRLILRGLYLTGTSGSLLRDMAIVLDKVRRGGLDTNVSVAAVSGLDGAIQGIRAVERQGIAGKIMVYPRCRGLGLTLLQNLPEEIRARLRDGIWTLEAETELLRRYGESAG